MLTSSYFSLPLDLSTIDSIGIVIGNPDGQWPPIWPLKHMASESFFPSHAPYESSIPQYMYIYHYKTHHDPSLYLKERKRAIQVIQLEV